MPVLVVFAYRNNLLQNLSPQKRLFSKLRDQNYYMTRSFSQERLAKFVFLFCFLWAFFLPEVHYYCTRNWFSVDLTCCLFWCWFLCNANGEMGRGIPPDVSRLFDSRMEDWMRLFEEVDDNDEEVRLLLGDELDKVWAATTTSLGWWWWLLTPSIEEDEEEENLDSLFASWAAITSWLSFTRSSIESA